MYWITGCLLMVASLMPGVAELPGHKATNDFSPRSLVEASYHAAQSLNSYTYRLTSITRHRGYDGRYKSEKKNVLAYSFRKPDQIRLAWLEPRRKRGQLAVYNGKGLRAATSWLPFAVSVDPDSPTGKDDFHPPIYRSSLASLMGILRQDLAKVTEERYEGLVAVGQRRAHRVVFYTAEKRVVVVIDSEHLLPLSIEQYDRESGLLFDAGYFEDMNLNPTLDDSLFDL